MDVVYTLHYMNTSWLSRSNYLHFNTDYEPDNSATFNLIPNGTQEDKIVHT